HTRFSRDWSSDVCSSDLDSLTVQWPDGNTQVLHQVLANQNIVLWQAEAIMPTSTISKKEAAAPPLFEAIDIQLGLDYQHHDGDRSEEHTSELQSRENLVCRLLLEKKKY